MKLIKTLLKIIGVLFILFILVSAGGIFYLSRGLETGSSQVIQPINLPASSDGTYTGRYESGRWTNQVSVTVKDHKITDIKIIKDVLFSKPEVKEEMIKKVIGKQNTNIDVVTGATVTCKAYLKAIENALQKK